MILCETRLFTGNLDFKRFSEYVDYIFHLYVSKVLHLVNKEPNLDR